MKRIPPSFVVACLILMDACGRAAEPTADQVWALVRNASVVYESLDAVDYDVKVKSPELEELLAAKTGGLGGVPEVHFVRRNLVSSVTFSLPAVPELFRAKAEARLEQETNGMDALHLMREMGWTLFASFLRTVDAGERYDVMEWNDAEALVEFNDLSEPMIGRIMRSCRIRFDRRRSVILQVITWYGGDSILEVDATYDPKAVFPGTKVPLPSIVKSRQTGFHGPAMITLNMQDGKYERSAVAQADEASTSRRAMLKRAGFNRFQIDQTRVDADGNIALDFSRSPVASLPKLEGLPVTSINLLRSLVSDLSPIRGLPLKRLVLDDSPVGDLSPLAGMKFEYLSLRNVRVADLRVVAQLPLKQLCIAGSSNAVDLSMFQGMKLESLDVEERPITDITQLHDMPLRELCLNRTKVRDLSPVRGMPLARLECAGTPLADLTPIAQCRALEVLRIDHTPVRDLQALAGLKITHLRINDTHIRDLAPLKGMPLRQLTAYSTDVTDVAPLLECPDLERLTLPRSVKNVEVLRGLPKLRELSFRFDNSRDGPAQTVEEFWKEFEYESFRKGSGMLASPLDAGSRVATAAPQSSTP